MNELILVGDRVLIVPEDGDKLTKAGLYLPATVAEKERIQGGRVANVGPGYVMPNPEYSGDPWAAQRESIRYLPLQAKKGDFAFFLRKEAIELTFKDKDYLIIPHNAIVALVRQTESAISPDDINPDDFSLDDLLGS